MNTRPLNILASVAFFITAAASPMHAASWWVAGKHDSEWTNKPIAEVAASAQIGNALAQFYYARACYFGNGRPQDASEALMWLKRGGEHGLADAQYMAARFYLSGTGTGRNSRTAVQWAERAAAQGHADAMAILGDAYANGLGVDVDATKARHYFEAAISGGSDWALDWFGHFLMSGEAATASKTNFTAALQYFERAASNGVTHAMTHLVDFYVKGTGTPPDVERAIFWAREAVDRNDVEMMERLARFYNDGLAEPRDASETTVELLRRAAGSRAWTFERWGPQRNTLRSLNVLSANARELCSRYRFGLGTPRDYISFAQWLLVLKRADAWGREMRMRPTESHQTNSHVFDHILTGKVTVTAPEDQRIREAVGRVNRALELRDAVACREIGEMYRRGSALTPESPIRAWLWLNRAAELKDTEAAESRSEIEKSLSPEQMSKLRGTYLPQSGVLP